MTLVLNHLQLLNGNKFMREFKIIIILFFVMIATSCGQQKKYISYTVKKGETIKVIAKRLGVKTKDLMRLNPEIGRKPAPETVIIIPNKQYQKKPINTTLVEKNDANVVLEEVSTIDEPINDFVLHKVAKGDTFYNLTRAYNVSEDQLNNLNPSLQITGLQLEMLLKIKLIEDEDTLLLYRDTIQENTVLKLAMMLPFRAIEYDTIDAKDIFKTNKLANITTDIYLGASIAIDSLRKLGIDVELSVFASLLMAPRVFGLMKWEEMEVPYAMDETLLALIWFIQVLVYGYLFLNLYHYLFGIEVMEGAPKHMFLSPMVW